MTTTPSKAPAAPRRIDYVDVASIQSADRNPRSHLSLEKVKGSIRRYGFVESAVHDGRTGKIVAGHGRTQALTEMRNDGEDVPEGIVVDEAGGWLMPVSVGWASRNDAEAEALLVNLNRLVETGGWQRGGEGGLTELLEDLRANSRDDFDLSGFDDSELDAMLAEQAAEEFEALEDPEDLDDIDPPSDAPAFTRRGDVWVIGRHRLVCGDSTDPAVVKRALGGAPAQLVFTDPPYGVKYQGQKGMKIQNDDLSASDLGRLLVAAFAAFRDVLIPGGTFYICSPSGSLETVFRKALEEVKLELRQQCIWMKDSLVLGRWDYQSAHETILYGWAEEEAGEGGEPVMVPPHFDPGHDTVLYGWKEGAAHVWEGGRKQTTVWLYPKPRRSEDHPTMKPVALVRRAVVNSSTPGEARGRVLDLFGGSGSTMAACEISNRSASLVELDEHYADVIVKRMFEKHQVDGVRESDGVSWSSLVRGGAGAAAAGAPGEAAVG